MSDAPHQEPPLARYLRLYQELELMREGEESPEELDLLVLMDRVWLDLTPQERASLDDLGKREGDSL
jgi:hypothetical protein